MAKKSNVQPSEVSKWLSRIQFADSIRKDADARYGYSRSLAEYNGDYAGSMPSFLRSTQLIPINEIYGFTKAFIPSVYSRNPHISCNPEGKRSIAGAKICELAVNAYWRELRLKNQVRRCIFDAIFAEGWMKVGYSAAFGSIEPKDGELPLESNEYVKNEEIFATRVSWKHIVRDPDAVDGIHDARWVAQKIIKPFDAVVNSPLYKNAKDLRPTHSFTVSPEDDIGLQYTNGRQLPGGETEEFFEFWEVWDSDTMTVRWLSSGASDDLRDPEDWPYGFDGFPFELLRFNDNSDAAYAPNLIGAWEPQLWEKIKIRSMQMDHLKRFNRQLWVKAGSVTPAQMEKFARGDTGAVNEFEGDMPPTPIQYPPIQTDIYAVEGKIDLDKDNISGQPNVVRSAPQKTQSRTLGELNAMVSAFQFRQVDPQSAVEDFCGEVAAKLIAIMKDYLPGEKFVRATSEDIQAITAAFGAMGARVDANGFKFNRKDIAQAEFDIEVQAGSTLPLDRQGRIEGMVNLLKLGPSIGINPNSEIAYTIGKNMLSEFDMKEIEVAYQKMLAAMKVQAELQKAAMMAQQMLDERKLAHAKQAVASMGEDGGGAAAPNGISTETPPMLAGGGMGGGMG